MRPISDGRLSILVVWEPILWLDSEISARLAARLFRDGRVQQFWVPDLVLAEAFQQPIGLKSEPAWDVYLLYEPGTRWTTGPPPPHDFMHQLGDRLPEEKLLDGEVLAKKISSLLAAAP